MQKVKMTNKYLMIWWVVPYSLTCSSCSSLANNVASFSLLIIVWLMGKANRHRTAIGSAKPHSQASQWLATGTRNTVATSTSSCITTLRAPSQTIYIFSVTNLTSTSLISTSDTQERSTKLNGCLPLRNKIESFYAVILSICHLPPQRSSNLYTATRWGNTNWGSMARDTASAKKLVLRLPYVTPWKVFSLASGVLP